MKPRIFLENSTLEETPIEELVAALKNPAQKDAALEALIWYFQPLVRGLAAKKKVAHPNLEFDELLQEGSIRLMEVLPDYEPQKGALVDFLRKRIRWRMQKVVVRPARRLIMIPDYKLILAYRIKLEMESRERKNLPAATPEDLARLFNVPLVRVQKTLKEMVGFKNEEALDSGTPGKDGKEQRTLAEIIPTPNTGSFAAEKFELLKAILNANPRLLTPKEIEYLMRHLETGASGKEIAADLGIKHQAVNGAIGRARKKLNAFLDLPPDEDPEEID